jgi:hypothetical protein
MTIHQMLQRLTAIMEAATPQEREEFRKSWLSSIPAFNLETKRMGQERLRNRSYPV